MLICIIAVMRISLNYPLIRSRVNLLRRISWEKCCNCLALRRRIRKEQSEGSPQSFCQRLLQGTSSLVTSTDVSPGLGQHTHSFVRLRGQAIRGCFLLAFADVCALRSYSETRFPPPLIGSAQAILSGFLLALRRLSLCVENSNKTCLICL
jgi:hypothetical protein